MNILLTGGAGYIGSHAAISFAQNGHNLVLLDNFSNSHRRVLDCLNEIIGRKLPFVECDIRDTAEVEKTLKDFEIDAVVHFAGLKSVSESVEAPIEYASNNIQGTVSLLKAMHVSNIKTLVFSSSATVYGEPEYLPLDENHPTHAVNPYGRNKLHIEEILSDVVASDEKWQIVSLRYFNPVGAHDSGLIGENPNGIPNNLLPYIGKVASGDLPYLNIYGDNYSTHDGTGVRDYIHVMDLVEGHLAALEYINNHAGYHVINLGTGVGSSVLEMIKEYELASHCKVKYNIAPRRPGDIASCFANVNKAKLVLGWVAKRSLKEMCSSAWNFQKNI